MSEIHTIKAQDAGLPVLNPQSGSGSIVFSIQGRTLLKLHSDGTMIVKGETVTDATDVVKGLREFIHLQWATGYSQVLDAAEAFCKEGNEVTTQTLRSTVAVMIRERDRQP
jgi:hypothetical protein